LKDMCVCRRTSGKNVNDGSFDGVAIGGGGNYPVIEIGSYAYGGYRYGVVVLNLFIMVLCGFVYFCNVWGCVCLGFVLYGCVRLV